MLRKISRLMFLSGISYGLLMIPLAGPWVAWCFGLIAAGVLSGHQAFALRALGAGTDQQGVSQRRLIEVFGSVEEIFLRCEKILVGRVDFHAVEAIPELGLLRARSRISLGGLGDKVELTLIELGGGWQGVVITSEPVLDTTCIDLGRNFRNVEKLAQAIQHPIQQLPAASNSRA